MELSRQANYETTIVKKILQWSGLNPSQFRERLPAEADFNVGWFRETLNFPAVLGTQKIDWVHDLDEGYSMMAELLKRPTKTRLYKAFSEWCDAECLDPEDTLVGLVFELTGCGTMIFHNVPRTFGLIEYRERTLAAMTLKIGKQTTVYTLEPLKAFVESLGLWADEHSG
jgi:hypothetical protein